MLLRDGRASAGLTCFFAFRSVSKRFDAAQDTVCEAAQHAAACAASTPARLAMPTPQMQIDNVDRRRNILSVVARPAPFDAVHRTLAGTLAPLSSGATPRLERPCALLFISIRLAR